jgi:xylulose-5-phosphate/fructose-6-phosphate phosphoketolase
LLDNRELLKTYDAPKDYNLWELQSWDGAMPKTLEREDLIANAGPLSQQELQSINQYWCAANYLSVGQIYLQDNAMLREPLKLEHTKPRLLGHFGTTPGLNFIYAHMNRVIQKNDLNVINVTGPGHGGPGIVANTYLEGSYTELYPKITQDEAGMQRLFKQFSWPGGIPSHASPDTPGSIHEGGELGYSLLHAYGAAYDNPDLLVCCVVGDGEAETGPCATSWHSNKFLNPARDGAVLPILHLNGYKIAGPTVLARIPKEELTDLFEGYGYKLYFVEGDDPPLMHQLMAATLDKVIADIKGIQSEARKNPDVPLAHWPMIVLRSPKGWTGPKFVDGLQIEGTFRAHQVPVTDLSKPGHLKILEDWMRSYKAEELFDKNGKFLPELAALAPKGNRRMGANPHANGGLLLKELKMPDFRQYAVKVTQPGSALDESTRVLGRFLRDVMKLNMDSANFRIMGPDETDSNRLSAVFEVTDRTSEAEILPNDDHVGRNGRVMEILSEHMCQGWLEGYLLTGRHGFFSCYEAFIHIVTSMYNQHAKWLEAVRHISWRKPIASLNYLLTSHVWRQDHNGFSHQDPGFLDNAVNKKPELVRAYFPPDANTLLSVADHCLRSKNYVNIIVAGKQPELQWLDMESAILHCDTGIGVWKWASNDEGGEPDAVMACAGDVPTLEILAAVSLLRKYVPSLKLRVVNVVDLMTLQAAGEHPHSLSDEKFDALFTTNKPVIFAYHGYPWLIHRLCYRRKNHDNMHVRGYKEEGTTTTPFDMVVRNNMDRFQLAIDTIHRIPGLKADDAVAVFEGELAKHKEYVVAYGKDMPEVENWRWSKS